MAVKQCALGLGTRHTHTQNKDTLISAQIDRERGRKTRHLPMTSRAAAPLESCTSCDVVAVSVYCLHDSRLGCALTALEDTYLVCLLGLLSQAMAATKSYRKSARTHMRGLATSRTTQGLAVRG